MCNILDHRKIKMIRKGPEGNTLVLLWMLMLIEAGKCNRGGYLMVSDTLPYTGETLSMVTDIPLPTVHLGLTIFIELKMIDKHDGAISIRNWQKYQSEDKLAARREKDRLRQQRHRARERSKMRALPLPDQVSRDSNVTLSRDVTLENRQDKRRIEKTTTDKIRLLLSETPLFKITDLELQGLEKRHDPGRLFKAADIAAETWRRNGEEMHNPGGYLHSLCSSLVVPDWYVPYSERMEIAEKLQLSEEINAAKQAEMEIQEKEEDAAGNALWASLSDEQREEYLTKALADLPAGIKPTRIVSLVMAKSLAWQEAQCGN